MSFDFDTIWNTIEQYFNDEISYQVISDYIAKLVEQDKINITNEDMDDNNLLLSILHFDITTSKHIEVAKLLITAGIDINHRNTALIWYLHNINFGDSVLDYEFFTMLFDSKTDFSSNGENIINYIKECDRIKVPCKWYNALIAKSCPIDMFKDLNEFNDILMFNIEKIETLYTISEQLKILKTLMSDNNKKRIQNKKKYDENIEQIKELYTNNQELIATNTKLFNMNTELSKRVDELEIQKRKEYLESLNNDLSMDELLKLIAKKMNNSE